MIETGLGLDVNISFVDIQDDNETLHDKVFFIQVEFLGYKSDKQCSELFKYDDMKLGYQRTMTACKYLILFIY